MADIKAAADDEEQGHHHHRFIVTDPLEEQEKKQPPHKSKRVASLDIFRGLTVAVLSLSLSLCLTFSLGNFFLLNTIIQICNFYYWIRICLSHLEVVIGSFNPLSQPSVPDGRGHWTQTWVSGQVPSPCHADWSSSGDCGPIWAHNNNHRNCPSCRAAQVFQV